MAAPSSLLMDLDEALLVSRILPHLAAADLGSLACTCQPLLALIHSLDTGCWLKAALEVLGPQHPVILRVTSGQPLRATSVRDALLRYSQSCQGLRTGSIQTGKPLMDVMGSCKRPLQLRAVMH